MLKVQAQKTDSESTLSFSIPFQISEKTKTYLTSSDAVLSPVASKLFGFPWTQAVTVTPSAVLVSKQDWVSWDVLSEPLSELLGEHFEKATLKGKPIEENPTPTPLGNLEGPVAKKINDLLEREINPAVASHGGRISLVDLKDQTAYISMGGGCQGCGMADVTLKQGVEKSLLAGIPEIKFVVDVTDHKTGENPYYEGAP
ncbi:MAG: NifU family protein [Bdellovibrionales bacterium]|nr:NifU family protein [Bdellovibrionales bacterium]